MGQLTFAQMRRHLLDGIGDSEAARENANDYLTEGLRRTWNAVDLPENAKTDESVIVQAGVDRVAIATIDFEVFSISNIFNVTDQIPCLAEPQGMMGRDRYLLKDTGIPPDGVVTNYMRDGTYLYVRNTPTVATTLRIRCRAQAPKIDDGALNRTSDLPSQYDWAIIHAAATVYYTSRQAPVATGPDGGGRLDQAGWSAELMKREQAFQSAIAVPAQPRIEEDRSRRESMRLRGYNMSPRSLRRI